MPTSRDNYKQKLDLIEAAIAALKERAVARELEMATLAAEIEALKIKLNNR